MHVGLGLALDINICKALSSILYSIYPVHSMPSWLQAKTPPALFQQCCRPGGRLHCAVHMGTSQRFANLEGNLKALATVAAALHWQFCDCQWILSSKLPIPYCDSVCHTVYYMYTCTQYCIFLTGLQRWHAHPGSIAQGTLQMNRQGKHHHACRPVHRFYCSMGAP